MPNDVFIQNRANAPVRPESAPADNETYRFPFKTPHELRMHGTPSTVRATQPGETGREYAIHMAAANVDTVLQSQQDRHVKLSPEQVKALLSQAEAYTAHTIYRRDEFLN